MKNVFSWTFHFLIILSYCLVGLHFAYSIANIMASVTVPAASPINPFEKIPDTKNPTKQGIHTVIAYGI